jgi:FtsH-binding integral membrane protein
MNSFSKEILQKIEERSIEPKPRWHFVLRNDFFYTIATLAVLTGGVAAAVMFYTFFDNDTIPGDLNETLFEDFLQIIPYLWMAILAFFVGISYVSIRQTNEGYRYKTLKFLVISVLTSLLLGCILNLFDFGQLVFGLFQGF